MTTHRITRTICVIALSTASVSVASTAQARQDPGTLVRVQHVLKRPLERVGSQLVRGDDLTGNGVEAPSWVPEH